MVIKNNCGSRRKNTCIAKFARDFISVGQIGYLKQGIVYIYIKFFVILVSNINLLIESCVRIIAKIANIETCIVSFFSL